MGRIRSLLIPGVDKQLLVRDAVKTMPDLSRRRFIAGGASFGALTLLTGCNVSDSFSAEEMLKQISKFNDGVQAAICAFLVVHVALALLVPRSLRAMIIGR